jgi:exodeoxyribonuclease-3
MRITTWNVNSIRQRLERVRAWLEANRPDVACLQETKVVDEDFPRAPFEALGYAVETYGQKTYNGVALLSRLPLTAVTRGFPDDAPDAPRRMIAATVGGLRVVNVYVPNGEAPDSPKFAFKMEWLARLETWLRGQAKSPEPLVVVGDFNIAPEERDVHFIEEWRGGIHFHPREHEALAKIRAVGLEDIFRRHVTEGGHYSWWDYRALAFPKNDGLRIDLILGAAAAATRSTACQIDRPERKGEKPSDHVPVTVTLT